MRKLVTIFLLMVAFGLIFAGAVSAQETEDNPSVDVMVTDTNGDPVTVTSPNDEVSVGVNVKSGLNTANPAVVIYVNPVTGLKFSSDDVKMYFGGKEYKNDPNDPFFSYEGFDQGKSVWVWDIGHVIGDMHPGQEAQLIAPAIVTGTGEINISTDFYQRSDENPEPELLASDSYAFLSTNTTPTPTPIINGETVPMQNTGAPLAMMALGLLGVIGGTIYGKIR